MCEIESYESVTELPDFNPVVLNGEDPKYIREKYEVGVEILGPWDEGIKAWPILIYGSRLRVREYLKHLRGTWPVNEKTSE